MSTKQHKIYITQDWGVFWGTFVDNAFHKHYAIQLSFAAKTGVQIISTDGQSHNYDCMLVKSNVEHQLKCTGEHLVFLFSPITPVGRFFSELSKNAIASLEHETVTKIREVLNLLIKKQLNFSGFVTQVKAYLKGLNNTCLNQKQVQDERIKTALFYLENNKNRVIPLTEIAKVSYLSPSRFLHLFKNELGITYRRAQLWIKIVHSFPYLQEHSITETAYQYGFSDSAHYSKIFKQNFGFSPKFLK